MTTGTAVAPANALRSFFAQHKAQIEAALPKHLTADRMARLALTAFQQNRALQNCDPKSVFAAVVVAGQMGLEIGVSGQGFLVPYGKKATFVPGWQGIVDLVGRSGRATVWTGAVFDGDQFDYALGDRPFVSHKPAGETDDPKAITHVYAIGRVNGAEWPVIEVWPIAKVWRHRDKMNKVGNQHYSFAHPEMYARKVPLLQVCKYMPKSIELHNALQLESAAERGVGVTVQGDFVTLDEDGDGTGNGDSQAPQRPAIARPKPKNGEAPKDEAGEGVGVPASEGQMALIAAKMNDAAITSEEVAKALGLVNLENIDVATANRALAFINDPVGFQP